MKFKKKAGLGLLLLGTLLVVFVCDTSPPPPVDDSAALETAAPNKLLLLVSNVQMDSHQALIDELSDFLSENYVPDETINALVLNVPMDSAKAEHNLESVVEVYGSENRLRLAADEVTRHFAERAKVDAYLAAQRVPKPYANKNWPDGVQSPGFRFMTPMYRRDGWTREQMETYWRTVHVPLAMATGDALFRYTNTIVHERLTADSPDFDAIVGMHFESAKHQAERFAGLDGFVKGLKSRLDGFKFQKIFQVSPEDMRETILKSGSMRQ